MFSTSIRLKAAVVFGAFLALPLLSRSANGQQTTNSTCTTAGSNINCASTTTDSGAQQQRAYEQGQQIGSALGQGLAGAMQAHAFSKGLKRYCEAHPGQTWNYYSRSDGHLLSSGHCPDDDDKAVAAANTFMARHKDFKPDPANSKAITTYFDTHQLDPREESSYERAYEVLKKNRQLILHAKK